jgi:hypothetical protein
MKRFKIDIVHLKRVLTLIIATSSLIIVLGLYVPLKKLIMGSNLTFGDVLISINYTHYFPIILLISLLFGLYSGKPEDEKAE